MQSDICYKKSENDNKIYVCEYNMGVIHNYCRFMDEIDGNLGDTGDSFIGIYAEVDNGTSLEAIKNDQDFLLTKFVLVSNNRTPE